MEVNEIKLLIPVFSTIYQTSERKGKDSCKHMLVCV